jgi:hypothetical protein
MKKRYFEIWGRRFAEGYPKPEAFLVKVCEGLRNSQRETRMFNAGTEEFYYWTHDLSLGTTNVEKGVFEVGVFSVANSADGIPGRVPARVTCSNKINEVK